MPTPPTSQHISFEWPQAAPSMPYAGLLEGHWTYSSHCSDHNLQNIRAPSSRVDFIHAPRSLRKEMILLRGLMVLEVWWNSAVLIRPLINTVALFAAKCTRNKDVM